MYLSRPHPTGVNHLASSLTTFSVLAACGGDSEDTERCSLRRGSNQDDLVIPAGGRRNDSGFPVARPPPTTAESSATMRPRQRRSRPAAAPAEGARAGNPTSSSKARRAPRAGHPHRRGVRRGRKVLVSLGRQLISTTDSSAPISNDHIVGPTAAITPGAGSGEYLRLLPVEFRI
jgi:hypothetical protein